MKHKHPALTGANMYKHYNQINKGMSCNVQSIPLLIYGIVPALSEFKVIHILIILHILFIPVPAVKVSPVIIQDTEHPVGIAGFIFRFFIAMFAYLLVGADYMAYETVAFRQVAKYRVLGIGMRIIVST